VRAFLADRRQRREWRRDIEWEQARTAYAAAAEHFAAEQDRRAAARRTRRAQEQIDRAALRAHQRGERDRTYRRTRRGIMRDIALAVQRGAHNRKQADLAARHQADRMTGAAKATRQAADRIAGRYDSDLRTAREAARQAASANRRTLAAWLDRAEVRAAQVARETAEQVRVRLDVGDPDTITAAARGDLAAAALAAQAAQDRRTAKDQRQQGRDEAEREAERHATAERARDAAQRAASARRAAPASVSQVGGAAAPARGLRPG
jgi:hypothetical protein